MTHVWAVVLGIVQGLAEFLPISSSAHLTIIPWIVGLPKESSLSRLPFDIALHAGSFLAILVALWADWVSLVRGAVKRRPADLRFIGFLFLTSIPGALFGVLFDKQAETVFRDPLHIAITLIVFGVVLWAVDRWVSRQEPLESMTWARAGIIGVAQAFAIFPGVSRSGATITAGRALGMSRDAIARYSFMAALPIIGGAAVFGLKDVPVSQLLSIDWILGFIASAVSSFFAMRLMLAYVRKHSLAVFMYYRIVFGVAVIALVLIRG